ncbi:biosynthetic arginine decarboxylase [Arcobacter sp. 15-2]|uniref:biosynthetic arginine decarboxylase n=1 Tax=Arcobacter sp. 15-2 TaxID=3374109 RepID=UPI00399D3156
MNNYGIDIWGDDNFIIDKGLVKLNYKTNPSLLEIVKSVRKEGNTGPLILRFPHIVQKQIDKLYSTFNETITSYAYDSKFYAVFPLKVNQFPNHILPMLQSSASLNYGLEAGSKAELLLAMSYNNKNSPITVNGFKDKQMIVLGFIAKNQGHDITLTIEGLNELETIIEVYQELNLPCPNIGLRVRLHSSGSGTWAKSGGINSKFGLSSMEILQAFEMLQKYNLTNALKMIHFHIGSDMNSISPLKKALKESGHIYVELKKMGADGLDSINIGGGLAIEYSQFNRNIQYSLKEFSNDVVFTLKDISEKNGVKPPNIFTESGRFIASPGSVLIAPTLELFSSEYNHSNIRLKEKNPPIIEELYFLYNDITKDNAKEYMHDSLEHLESILTLFDLGYVDLTDRSNAEVLTNLIIKKAIKLKDTKNDRELKILDDKIQEKYLLNFSIFQSLPDFWGIDQEFPIMPLTHLDKDATRSANIWDITCDSDGEIPFKANKPLYLHDVDLAKEEYFLGFFLVGAYQDTLGMKHNLFSSPSQVNIIFTNDEMKVESFIKSQSILDIFEDLDYDTTEIVDKLLSTTNDNDLKEKLEEYLEDNSYLKTTQIEERSSI